MPEWSMVHIHQPPDVDFWLMGDGKNRYAITPSEYESIADLEDDDPAVLALWEAAKARSEEADA